MRDKQTYLKPASGLTLGVLGFFLGVLLYPIIFHVPHGAKITKVVSDYQMATNSNLAMSSGQYLFENYDNLEPTIISGTSELTPTKSSTSSTKGKISLSIVNLGNLQYILNANLYAKFSEYSNIYSKKKAETIYSLDKILGKENQRTILPIRLERIDIEGRVKSIAQGSFSKKNKGRIYMALLTDAFEVVMIDRDSREMLWKVDFKNYLDTSKVQNIEEYVVSLQTLPGSDKYSKNSQNWNEGDQNGKVPQGPPTQDGIYPTGKEKKGLVFAVWRIRLIPDMFGSRYILLLAAIDGKTGEIKWASIAETLDNDSNNALRKMNPEPVYFNLGEINEKDETDSITTKSDIRSVERKDKNKIDIIGILSHMAACRLPMSSNSNTFEGSSNSVILGVNAKKYTTKSINKRSNVNAANTKSSKSTFREIVEASSSGNTELSYKADTLLFVSSSHIIAADFEKGEYLFGAILQKGTLLFSVGDIPYVFYTVSSCGARKDISNKRGKSQDNNASTVPCAVLAEVNPTEQVVNKIHWAVTLEDGVVSKKLKAKKSSDGRNTKTFTGNLVDTPIKPLIFQENVFTPPRLVVLSPTGYIHSYDLNGNTLWARPSQCGNGDSMITLSKIEESKGEYVSLSAQQVSGKSVVVTVCGGLITIMWADTGEIAGTIQVGEESSNTDNIIKNREVISSIIFSQVAPAPSAPIVSIVKAKISDNKSSEGEENQNMLTMPLQSTNYYLDVYALSGFDGNASSGFFYTACCVLVAGLLGMLLVSSFPPPSLKQD